MSSKIKATNAHGKTLTIENIDSVLDDVNITSKDLAGIKSVDTIADLRTMKIPVDKIWASGYHTKNDGAFGSHIFRLKGVKTTETDNGGTVIITTINAVDYVYELQYKFKFAEYFGAKGDGACNDQPYLQAAINDITGSTVYLKEGSRYKIDTPLVPKSFMTIIGAGNFFASDNKKMSAIFSNNAISLFESTSETKFVKLTGITFYGLNCTAYKNINNYAANWEITHCSFSLSLAYGLRGVFVGSIIFRNYFGILTEDETAASVSGSFMPLFIDEGSTSNQPNANTIRSNRFEYSSSTYGSIYVRNSYGVDISNNIIEYSSNADAPVTIIGTGSTIFSGNYFEQCTDNRYILIAKRESGGSAKKFELTFDNNFIDSKNTTLTALIGVSRGYVNVTKTLAYITSSFYITEDLVTPTQHDVLIREYKGNDVNLNYAGEKREVIISSQNPSTGNPQCTLEVGNPILTGIDSQSSMTLRGYDSWAGSILQLQNNETKTTTSLKTSGKIEMYNGTDLDCWLHGLTGGTIATSILEFGAGGTGSARLFKNNLSSYADAISSLGSASVRWNNSYFAVAPTVTSDDRNKTYLTINEKEVLVAKELKKLMKKFQFNASLVEKGDNARIHFGTSAQSIKKVFEDNGLNPFDYALLCYDEWEDEYETKVIEEAKLDEEDNIIKEAVTEEVLVREAGNRYGIRYEELLCFIISAL